MTNKMKYFWIIVLAVVLMFSVFACGKEDPEAVEEQPVEIVDVITEELILDVEDMEEVTSEEEAEEEIIENEVELVE